MIAGLSIFNWLSILFSIIIITGPGWLILSLIPNKAKIDFTSKSIIAFCLSLGIWAFVLSILRLFPQGLTKRSIIFFFAIIWVLIITKNTHSFRTSSFSIDIYQVILWVFSLIAIFIILFSLKGIVTGLGSDSYHHTLISQLIYEQGKAPTNYFPYAPLTSFSYHFGFHALVALIATFTGVPVQLLVPITGTLIVGLASLGCYFLAIQLFNDNILAFAVGIITICITVIPFYLVNFSRFPQLLGLLYCTVFIGFFIMWSKYNFSYKLIPNFSIIALGLAFAHYRVTIMSVIGLLLYIFFVRKQNSINNNLINFDNLKKWVYSGLMTILLFLPWVIQIYLSSKIGVSGDIGPMNSSFFNINRLGTEVIQYPTNFFIYFLLFVALILSIKIGERKIFWLFSWVFFLLVLSNKYLLNLYMDTVSTIFSLFIPIALITGWAYKKMLELVPRKYKLKNIFVAISSLFVFYCVSLLPQYIHPEYSFVTQEDIKAFDWINLNIAKHNNFIVNTYNFNFNKNYIIGIDAGYWIPFFTENSTVSIPMIYLIERVESDQIIEDLRRVHAFTDFTSKENIEVIREIGYSYLYLGENGSKNHLGEIQNSNFYDLVYNSSNTYIFRIKIVQ